MVKRGFTLIELLATIVVLGMLAVITTPIVLNTINNSKRNSAKAAALSYVDTFNKEISVEDYDETKRAFRIQKDGSLLSNGTTTKLVTKGVLPTEGIICLDENNSVTIYSLLVDGYVINYYGEEQEISRGDKALNLTCDVTKEVVTMSINSNICSKTKIVTIEFPPIASVKKQYRINSGEWLEYSEPLVMKDNATVYARLYDGVNSSNMATLTVSKMDKEDVSGTKPNVILSAVNPTNSVVVTFRQTDDCGLDNDTIEYGISRDNKTYTWQKDNYFMRLKNNTLYYVKTRANDIALSGLKESDAFTITTGEISTPVITVNPSTEWAASKTITITGVTTGAKLQYQIGKTTGTWLDYTEPFKVAQNTTTYARLYDGVNASSTSTYTVTKIDTTNPLITTGTISKTTRSMTVPYTATDSESGIKTTTCIYGTSTNYGSNGTIINNNCSITNIKNSTTYYYKIVTTNNAGLTKEITGNSVSGSFGTINVSENNSNWTTSKVITVTGTTTGAKLQYQLGKTTGTWVDYKAPFTINSNTTVYARLYDGLNASINATLNVTKIDTIPPTCSSSGGSDAWTNNGRTLVGTCSDSGGSECTGNVSWLINWQGNWTGLSSGTVYDNAGNATACPYNQTVRVDKTAPEAWYYRNPGYITVTCTDRESGTSTGSYADYDWSLRYFTNMYNGNAIDFGYGESDTMHIRCYDNVGHYTGMDNVKVK